MNGETVIFYIFAGIALLGGAGVIFLRRVVYSLLALMVSLFGVAGMYMLLAAPFLAVTQVLLYIGGVAILLLFGIFVAQQAQDRPLMDRSPHHWLALLAVAIIVFWVSSRLVAVDWTEARRIARLSTRTAQQYTMIHQNPETAPLMEKLPHVEYLGYSLTRTYVLPFVLSSFLLLVALLGAIILLRDAPQFPEEEEKHDRPGSAD